MQAFRSVALGCIGRAFLLHRWELRIKHQPLLEDIPRDDTGACRLPLGQGIIEQHVCAYLRRRYGSRVAVRHAHQDLRS